MAIEITLTTARLRFRSWEEEARGAAVSDRRAESLLREALADPLARPQLASLLAGEPLYQASDLEGRLATGLASGRLVLERLGGALELGSVSFEPVTAEAEQEVRLGSAAGAAEEVTADLDWIEIELLDEDGEPVPYELFELTLADGEVRRGNLNAQGVGRVSDIPAGTHEVTFPRLYASEWSR